MAIGTFHVNRVKLRRRTILALLCSVLSIWAAWLLIPVRSFESVRRDYRPSDVWVVDHQGVPMVSVRVHNDKRSLGWVQWKEVSQAFADLLVRVEDQRFYHHPGVDGLAIVNAFRERLSGQSRRGASTLPMQLVSLLEGKNSGGRRSFFEKLIQAGLALKLRANWTEDQVLEAYINYVPFRGELVGLRAASLGYFGKDPAGLLLEEAAILVALLRSPNADAEQVAKRACRILELQECEKAREIALDKLSLPYRLRRSRDLVPILSERFISRRAEEGLIETSLDYRIQELALGALREQLRALGHQNVKDGAVLVLESGTGRVMAYVANGGEGMASADQIDGIQTKRQAGSTIKPFVYATAFDWRLLEPQSLLDDSPMDISIAHGRVYQPRNYDHVFRGKVSAAEALGSSMNVPAVRALQLVGESRLLERMRALGFENLREDEYYGPSLALGAVDVSLWELTHAYRQFAVEGSVFRQSTREAIHDILSLPEYRRFTFGIDSVLALPFPAAVKTGTSKDMRDNWCIGFTPRFTVGVWVGNFTGEPMWNVSGLTGAAPIWRTLMLALHPNAQGAFGRYIPPAPALVRRTITRISYPAADMFVGIDPDIPREVQKLPIEIENPQPGQMLYLNGRLLGKAKNTVLWEPKHGKYYLELKTASGKLLDSIKFEVR